MMDVPTRVGHVFVATITLVILMHFLASVI